MGGEKEGDGREKKGEGKGREGGLCSSNISFKKPWMVESLSGGRPEIQEEGRVCLLLFII